MNINATLLGQTITFILFVWFTMSKVWPLIAEKLQERQDMIATGLAQAERAEKELELARDESLKKLKAAKATAHDIVDKANKRGHQIVEDARLQAKQEGKRLLEIADEEIQQHVVHAKQVLRKQVGILAIAGAGRILAKEIDEAANSDIISSLISELK